MRDRLAKLTPDSRARWGRFTAPKMVLHVIEGIRMSTGELTVGRRSFPLQFLIRPLFIYALPFPKGAPTAPELLARKPESWEADVSTLDRLIDSLDMPAAGTKLPDHPAFGPMSTRDWGHIIYKHLDHHFRQFGI